MGVIDGFLLLAMDTASKFDDEDGRAHCCNPFIWLALLAKWLVPTCNSTTVAVLCRSGMVSIHPSTFYSLARTVNLYYTRAQFAVMASANQTLYLKNPLKLNITLAFQTERSEYSMSRVLRQQITLYILLDESSIDTRVIRRMVTMTT